MKIILTARVSNLGQIGEVVEVKNGYAKNFLIPNKKAICFTANNQKVFEAKKSEFERANNDNLSSAQNVKNKLAGKNIVVIESASDDGRLYGSVNSASIAAKINDELGDRLVSRGNIFLSKPIKEIGVYSVKVDLHADVAFDAKLIVTRSESEIEALLKADAKANGKEGKKSAESAPEAVAEVAASDDGESEKPAKKARKKKSEKSE